jgi:hypothetical protein
MRSEVERLARLSHGERHHRRHVELRRERAPSATRRRAWRCEHAPARSRRAATRDQAVTDLAGQGLAFGPKPAT